MSSADALTALTEAALRRGDAVVASERLDRLRAEHPDDPRVPRLDGGLGALRRR